MATADEVLQRYPQFAAFINHPEIGPLLLQAADQGFDSVTLQGKLHQTQWWQKTWADARQLEVLKGTDPAEFWARHRQTTVEVQSLFRQLGVSNAHHPNLAGDLANEWLKRGKDDWFLFNELGNLMSRDPSLVGDFGDIGARKAKFRTYAKDMLLDYSDQALNHMAIANWRNQDSDEAIQNRLRIEAMRRFGHLKDELERGLTVREIASPMVNAVARLLEISPDEVDLAQPRWRQMIDYKDQDTGKQRSMTITEAERFARRSKPFETTKTARDEAHGLALKVMENMGAIAT